jgi:hypothetical protein
VVTAGTFRRFFEKIIGQARIVARKIVENAFEEHPRILAIAVLTGLDNPLGLADRRAADQDNIVLSEAGIEVVLCHVPLDSSAEARHEGSTDCEDFGHPRLPTNQTQMTAVNALIVIRKP